MSNKPQLLTYKKKIIDLNDNNEQVFKELRRIVCDMLNDQEEVIQYLEKENERLKKENE